MKKNYFLNLSMLLGFVFSINIVIAGNGDKYKVAKERLSSEHSSIPTYIQFDASTQPSLSELSSVYKKYWKTGDFDFVEIGQEADMMGFLHYRYRQTYKGIPIMFAELIAHTKSDKIYSVNGEILAAAPSTNESNLTEGVALAKAKDHIGAESYKWEYPDEEAHLKMETGDAEATYFPKGELIYITKGGGLDPKKMRLAYRFNIYAQQPLSRYEIYIDAGNGEMLFKNNLIHTGNVEGTAVTAYSGTRTITTDSLAPDSFRLRETSRGNGINTYNMLQGFFRSNAVDFTDDDNHWNNVNAQLDEYATDAHWAAQRYYDYLDTMFNRNSINGNGFALNSYVHYRVNFSNAFWDGQRMTYGDGNPFVDPFTTVDIAGHEITHGLTDFTADLIYQREQGGLNESFSDIFGAALEAFARPNDNDWTIGEDRGSTIRSMSNPNSFGDPDTYLGTFWKAADNNCIPSNQNDQCGVHSNSGVQNFWFYLLTDGGTGINDHGDSYSITGVGIDTAAAVAFRNLTVYLTRFSDYEDARFFSIQSALDLYGSCSNVVEAVTNAWYAVGVGDEYVDGVISDFESADTISCFYPFTVNFTILENNGTGFTWDFGDGNVDSTRNPIHVFTNHGDYDIQLIVDGGSCGADTMTKTAYVSIDTNRLCRVPMNDGINQTQVDCDGKLLDNGGLGGDYENNINAVITIAPPGASHVELIINSIDIQAGSGATCDNDVLEIFDGNSVNAPSLGAFCNGSVIPPTISSRFSTVTVRFTSNGSVTAAGFDIDWLCKPSTTVPSVEFLVSSDSSCTGEISFQDYSTELPTSWAWTFGDGASSSDQNPIHQYTSNGTYDVQLIATNSFGSDTIKKVNFVKIDRPVAPSAMNDSICRFDTANFLATGSGSGTLRWFDRELGGAELFTGSTVSINQVGEDTSLWVEELVSTSVQTVGPIDRNIGASAFVTEFEGLIFDVFEDIELVSVLTHSNASKTRTFELRDKNGVLVQSAIRFVPFGDFQITLNMEVKAGEDYQLTISAVGGPDLARNDGGVSYPYEIPGLVSIKESTNSTNPKDFYYYFYNWKVKSADCVSPRTEVKAVVDVSCIVGINNNKVLSRELKVYPNPVKENLLISYPVSLAESIESIRLLTIGGQEAVNDQGKLTNDKGLITINVSDVASGVYFLRIQTQSEVFTRKVVISK